MITLDVKNAFNTARWDVILDSLEEKGVSAGIIGCVRSYFGRRKITTGMVGHEFTMGVPQGSVLGPILWDVMYDGVLRLPYGPGVQVVAYADDLRLVVEGGQEGEVRDRAETAVGRAVE